MNRQTIYVAAGAVALAALIPAVALASAGAGVVDVSTRGDGVLDGPVKVNVRGVVKLQAYADLRVFDQELTIQPGGHTGWHSHPGPVLVTVTSGTFRYQEDDCSFRDYGAGKTVLDPGGGHVHIGRNPSRTQDLHLSITYLLPAGAPPRIDKPEVIC